MIHLFKFPLPERKKKVSNSENMQITLKRFSGRLNEAHVNMLFIPSQLSEGLKDALHQPLPCTETHDIESSNYAICLYTGLINISYQLSLSTCLRP